MTLPTGGDIKLGYAADDFVAASLRTNAHSYDGGETPTPLAVNWSPNAERQLSADRFAAGLGPVARSTSLPVETNELGAELSICSDCH